MIESTLDVPAVDLTAGIPQSAADPNRTLLGVAQATPDALNAAQVNTRLAYHGTPAGIPPWEQDDEQTRKELVDRYFKGMDNIDAEVLADTGTPEGPRRARVDLLAVNDAWLDLHSEEPVPPSGLGRKLAIQKLSMEQFGGAGARDDESLRQALRTDAQQRRDKKAVWDKTLERAAVDEILTRDDTGSSGRRGFFKLQKDHIAGMPGDTPEDIADRAVAYTDTRIKVRHTIARFRPQLDKVFSAFEAKEDYADAARAAYEALAPADRKPFLAALRVRSKELSQTDQDGFFVNFFKSARRDVGGMLYEGAVGALDLAPVGEIGPEAKFNYRYRKQDLEVKKEFRARESFVADVVELQQQTYDPIRYLTGEDGAGIDSMGYWKRLPEKVVYALPGLLGNVGAAIYASPLLFASLTENHHQSLRRTFLAQGQSEQEAEGNASVLAPVGGALELIGDSLTAGLVRGRLPFFDKALTGMMDRIKSPLARGVTRFGAGWLEEGVQEVGQNYIDPMVRKLGTALALDIRGVQWLGKGGELDGFWAQSIETFAIVGPLSIMGVTGGSRADSRVKAFTDAPDVALRALGIPQENIDIFRLEAAKGLDSGNASLDKVLSTHDPNSADAKAATEEMKAQMETANQAKASGVVPVVIQSADGYAVLDGETREVVASGLDQAGAERVMRAHSAAMDESRADQTAYMASLLEGGAEALEMDTTGQARNSIETGTRYTEAIAAAEDPGAIDQFHEQAALHEQINGGTGEVAMVALGRNVMELRGKVRTFTNRLFQGASVTTIVHEMGHGMLRELEAAGVIVRDEKLRFVRAVDSVMRGQVLKRGMLKGQKLALLPEGIADADITDGMLNEGISHILESELLRTRKLAKDAKALRISPGIISRNLLALSRMAPGATRKFRAFLEAARGVLGLTSARALAMKKALREGTLDKADYEAFLNKLTGRDLQAEHDGTVRDEHAALVGQEAFTPTEDEPFSMVPAGPGLRKITEAPEVVKIASDPFEGFESAKKSEWLDRWKQWEEDHRSEWRQTIPLPEGNVLIGGRTFDETGVVKRKEVLAHHFQAAAMLPGLLRNSKLAIVESATGKPTAQEVHKRYAWADFPDGTRHHVLMTVIRWKGEDIQSDTAYSVEALEVQEEAAPVTRKLQTPTDAALAAGKGDAETLARFLAGIKHEHRWVVQDSFSLAPAAFVDSLSMNVASRIKDPRVKAAMFTRMLEKLSLLKRDRDELGIAFGKGYKRKAIEDPRKTASIKREAAFREATRRAELEEEAYARHNGILDQPDLAKLKAQPVHAALADPATHLRGRLMGYAQAVGRGIDFFDPKKQGDYDGSDGVSRSVFGGTIAPDVAAEELFGAGLINAPTPDALWAALKREAATVEKMRGYMAAAREDVRKARLQAKEEAKAWEWERLKEESANYSPRQRLLRALAMLDGILTVLPPEVRGRIGGYTQLARLASDEARLKFLSARVALAEEHVDAWIKGEHRKELSTLREKARPKKNKPGEALRGRIGVDAHRVFGWVERYYGLDETQLDAERLAIENEEQRMADESVPGVVHPEALELANRARVLDLAGGFEGKTVADQAAALSWLRGAYTFGRDEWQAKESDRLAEVAGLQRILLETLAAQKGVTLPRFEMPKFDHRRINGMTPAEAEPLMRDHDTLVRNTLARHKAKVRKLLEEGGVGSLAARQQRAAHEASRENRTALEAGSGEFLSFVQVLERLLGPGHSLVTRWNQAVGDAQKQKTHAMLAADKAWLEAAAAAMGNPGIFQVQERLWEMSAEQSITIQKQIREPGVEMEIRLANVPGLLDGTADPAEHGLTTGDFPALQEALDAHNAVDRKGRADTTEFLKFKTTGTRTAVEVNLTPMQAVTLVLTSRQARYAKNLELHGFTPDVVQSAVDQLGPEAMSMADWLGEFYRENYEPLAVVFREMFGVDLPLEENYSPFRAERGGTDKEIGGPAEAAGMVPEGGFRANFTKTRAPSHSLAPALQGAVSVFQGHVASSEHWRAFAPLVREMKAVLGGLETRQAIEAVHGRALVNALDGWLLAFEQNGLKQRKVSDGVDHLIRGMQRNIAVLGLAFRFSTLIKNYVLPAFGTARRIGVGNWARGLARFAAGKISYRRFREADYITLRADNGFSPELRMATSRLRSEKPTRAGNLILASMRLIGTSDAQSTALGAAIAWDYHFRRERAAGLSEADASALADRLTEDDVRRTAQPLELAERSLYELSSNEAARLLFLFATDARKESALFFESARRAWKENSAAGLLTSAEFRSTAGAIWLSTGLINTVISRMLRDMMDGGDDDKWFDERNWSLKAVLAQALLGPAGGIPLIRDLASGWNMSEMAKATKAFKAMKDLGDALWHMDIPDKNRVMWMERRINRILIGLGLFHKGAAEAGAFSNLVDQSLRMIENADPL